MALLFTEGFDWSTNLASNYVAFGKWFDSSNGSVAAVSGDLRFGTGSGNYWTQNTSSIFNNYIRRAIGSNLASGVIGVAFKTATHLTTYNRNLIVLFDTTSNVQMGLKANADGTLSVYRTSHSNILGTSTFALLPNTWYYIELKWKISDSISANDVIVYIDGTDVLNLAATTDTKNTANAYATHYAFGGDTPTTTTGTNAISFFDDHYLIDLTGSVNNAPLGPVRIQTLSPSANGNTSQFTGSDGNTVNNFQQVDDIPLNTADYNDGTTSGNKDTYGYTDTVAATTTIKGLTINSVVTKTDTDPRGVKPVVRHSGTDYDGTELLLSASTVNNQQVYETNPGTSSGWTKSDVDAAEFGLKVST
jgi:hypothetical protein